MKILFEELTRISKKFAIALLVMFVIVACSKDDGNNPNPNNPNENIVSGDDWGFLKVGNKWEYEAADIQTGEVRVVTVEILSEEYRQGFRYLVYDYRDSRGNNNNRIGDYFLENDKQMFCNPFIFSVGERWKYELPTVLKNASKGQKWDWTTGNSASPTNKTKIFMEVLSINATVTVLNRTFTDCIQIKETNDFDDYEDIVYIHKKYGVIRAKDNSETFLYRLKSTNF